MKTIETTVSWVNFRGYPVKVGGDITAHDHGRRLRQIQYGDQVVGDISELIFRDPDCFKAGELHNDFVYWRYITRSSLLPQQTEILGRDKVSIERYFRHFKGSFKGESYDSEQPPMKVFRNNVSCKPFGKFVEDTVIARVKSGAILLLGKVGVVSPPYIVLPLAVEPTKPRLCHHARCFNLWMSDMPFSLDRVDRSAALC